MLRSLRSASMTVRKPRLMRFPRVLRGVTGIPRSSSLGFKRFPGPQAYDNPADVFLVTKCEKPHYQCEKATEKEEEGHRGEIYIQEILPDTD